MISRISLFMRSTTSFGSPGGPASPSHDVAATPLIVSDIVGISGASGKRSGDDTASPRIAPASTCGIVEVPVSMNLRVAGQSRIFNSWISVGRYMAATTLLCLARWQTASARRRR